MAKRFLLVSRTFFLAVIGLLVSAYGVASPPPPAATIYVTDSDHNRIVWIDDMTGAGWTTLDTFGHGLGRFRGPSGIFVR